MFRVSRGRRRAFFFFSCHSIMTPSLRANICVVHLSEKDIGQYLDMDVVRMGLGQSAACRYLSLCLFCSR